MAGGARLRRPAHGPRPLGAWLPHDHQGRRGGTASRLPARRRADAHHHQAGAERRQGRPHLPAGHHRPGLRRPTAPPQPGSSNYDTYTTRWRSGTGCSASTRPRVGARVGWPTGARIVPSPLTGYLLHGLRVGALPGRWCRRVNVFARESWCIMRARRRTAPRWTAPAPAA